MIKRSKSCAYINAKATFLTPEITFLTLKRTIFTLNILFSHHARTEKLKQKDATQRKQGNDLL